MTRSERERSRLYFDPSPWPPRLGPRPLPTVKILDHMVDEYWAYLKGWKAMMAMKAMKAMRVSKIAKGRRAKSLVFRGKKPKVKTVGF